MNYRKCVKTDLICPKCGNIVTIQRKKGKQKKTGHLKYLYCYDCREIINHYEVNDIAKFLLTYNKQNIEQKNLVNLVLSRRKNDR